MALKIGDVGRAGLMQNTKMRFHVKSVCWTLPRRLTWGGPASVAHCLWCQRSKKRCFQGKVTLHTDPIRNKQRAQKQHKDSVATDSLGTVEGAKAHCPSESLPLPGDLREPISHKRSWSSESQSEHTGKRGSLLPVRKLF